MVRMAGSDVASSNSRPVDQVTTAVGSGASGLPCDPTSLARGVAISSASAVLSQPAWWGRVVGTTWSAAW